MSYKPWHAARGIELRLRKADALLCVRHSTHHTDIASDSSQVLTVCASLTWPRRLRSRRPVTPSTPLPTLLTTLIPSLVFFFFFQAEDGIRDVAVTGVQTCALPIFVERLIGTLRREYLDHMLFWTTADLENKLLDFRTYFNNHRTHNSLAGQTPDTPTSRPPANLRSFRWQPHCRALYQTPMAA